MPEHIYSETEAAVNTHIENNCDKSTQNGHLHEFHLKTDGPSFEGINGGSNNDNAHTASNGGNRQNGRNEHSSHDKSEDEPNSDGHFNEAQRYLHALLTCPTFTADVMPHLKAEYFLEKTDRAIFEVASWFFTKYGKIPTPGIIASDLAGDALRTHTTVDLGEEEFDGGLNFLLNAHQTPPPSNLQWLTDECDAFIRHQATAAVFRYWESLSPEKCRDFSVLHRLLNEASTAGLKSKHGFIVSGGDYVLTPPDYVFKGYFQRGFLYAITGHSGRGKTAGALLMGGCVGSGTNLGNIRVKQGPVLYLAGENPLDVQMRWAALCLAMGWDRDCVKFIFGTPTLSEEIEAICVEATMMGEFSLVIVDTAAAYYEGDEENANAQQKEYAQRLRKFITLIPGTPAVIVLCHPTKGASDDDLKPRGGYAFYAEIDGNMSCKMLDLGTGSRIVEFFKGDGHKHRGVDYQPFSLRLEPATTPELLDSDGEPIHTIVAKPITTDEVSAIDQKAASDVDMVLRCIGDNPGITQVEICNKLGWVSIILPVAGEDYDQPNDTKKPNKMRANRAVNKLKAQKPLPIQVMDNKLLLTTAGKKYLETTDGASKK